MEYVRLFAELSSHIWIGKVNTIVVGGGVAGTPADYASWAYGSSCMFLEGFMWSQIWEQGNASRVWNIT